MSYEKDDGQLSGEQLKIIQNLADELETNRGRVAPSSIPEKDFTSIFDVYEE